MSALDAKCPPESTLSDFGLGKLDAANADTVSQHIETCADCRQRVVSLSGDSFVGRLQKADRAAGHAKRERTYTSGESRANSASSTDGSLIKEDGHLGASRSADDLSQRPGAENSPSISAPPELANHPDYELIKELGQGGMGTVYLAKNRMMGRLEVLKVISQAVLNKPGARERFLQEIQAAASLNQPNIVAAYSVIRIGEALVFSMEYVKGQDLEKVVVSRGYLPVANATFYIHQVALGLQHAHERRMVHRDIKPNNLMLAIEGKKHVVKILDFGLAKATSEKDAETRQTKSGQMLGTPLFASPEQISDARSADIRADVYSLGCTLYYLLSGGPPFQDQSLFELLRAHHECEATPLNIVRPEVSVELAAVVAKMMAKDPSKRYQTPIEVSRALVPFFKPGQSVATSSPSDPLAQPVAENEYGLSPAAFTTPIAPLTPLPAANPLPTGISAISQDRFASRAAGFGTMWPGTAKIPLVAGERSATRAKPWLRSNLPLVIGIALALPTIAFALWAAGAAGVFRLRTADGTLVVKVNEPNPDVYVDGEKITVAWQNGGMKAEIAVRPGTRKVEVKKDGFIAFGEEVTLEDHGRETLTARLDPDPDPPNPPDADVPDADHRQHRPDESPEIVNAVDDQQQGVEKREPHGRQVNARELRPKSAAELDAIKGADIDRGKSVLASTHPAEIAEIVGEVAPGFTAIPPVIPGGVAIVAEHFGRTCVLSTHPLDRTRPCVLTSTIDVPLDAQTLLTFDVSHSRAGDWQVIVLANGELLYESPVGPTTAANGWLAVSVDLTRFAGTQVVLELQNKATDYSHEWGFWDNVKITSRDGDGVREISSAGAIPPDSEKSSTSSEETMDVSSEDINGMPPEGGFPGEEREDNALKLKLCWCPAGRSPGFWMGKYEVTQAEWAALMGSMPSQEMDRGKGNRHPIYYVSQDEAMKFCQKLTDSERNAGRLPQGWTYQLPAEDQWEYACRAGTTTATAFGDSLSSTQANFNGDWPHNGGAKGPSLQRAVAVGSYRPNSWGIYDMHGNVKEFTTTPGHVRGGSWYDSGRNCCSEIFIPDPPQASESIGFRVVRVPSANLRGTTLKPLKRMGPETTEPETSSAGVSPARSLKIVIPAKRTMGVSQASRLDRAADTGLQVNAGEHISLVVTGEISLKRQAAQKSRQRRDPPKSSDDSIVCAIGQAGKEADQRVEGRPATDFVARSSGSLFIGIADNSREDNEGSLTVEIRIE